MPVTKIDSKFGILYSKKKTTTKIHLRHSVQVRAHSGEGNGTPLQYSCLENPMGGGAWWAAVHGVGKSRI